jgi:acyl-coenzyme A thioesterase PaaI-like protein
MASSLFIVDGDEFHPTELSRGPWSADALHGGPVAALLAHELSAVPTVAEMFPARLTVELWRSLTFTPYRVTTEVLRPGRKVQVVEARLLSGHGDGHQVVARATLQQIAADAVDLPVDIGSYLPATTPPKPPEDSTATATNFDGAAGAGGAASVRFDNTAVEHRASIGSFMELGPATDWIRVVVDLLPGVALSPFERVAAAADFGNGVSATLPWDRYVFVNPDLTIQLFRLPVDEWVCLDAATYLDPSPGAGGVGFAESTLYDRDGRLGRATQGLYIAPV